MIQIFSTDKIPSDFLEALRLSMNYVFVTKEEIWDWAMNSIRVTDSYDPILLEIISGSEVDARQIDYAIKKRTENEKTDQAFRILVSFISQDLFTEKLSSKEAARELNKICLELEIDEADWEALYLFDNDLYLADSQIIGDTGQIEASLKRTVEPYKKLQFDNYEDWRIINREIDERIKPAANKI
ncbi:hypothetical protein BH23BAC3_BH23BAC3_25640 [soil metagenome]